MKVTLLVVGRAGSLVADGVQEYEQRARRYWNLEVVELKEVRAHKGMSDDAIRALESDRLLQRMPDGAQVVALTRAGKAWTSAELAAYLTDLALHGKPGVAFLIGGALGLSDEAVARADNTLSISAMTLTHELARLVFVEQLYRAGTIARGEPYHKARV